VRGRPVLITAWHVVEQALQHKLQVVNFAGKGVALGGLEVVKSREQDVAAILLPEQWLQENDLHKFKGVELGKPGDEWLRTGVYVAIGYPASKNNLNKEYGKVDRYCHSISMPPSSKMPKTTIPNPLVLEYDHTEVIDSNVQKMGPQVSLHGMSGGPCMEVVNRRMEDGSLRYSMAPVGVLTEWHKKERLVVASRLAEVFPELYG